MDDFWGSMPHTFPFLGDMESTVFDTAFTLLVHPSDPVLTEGDSRSDEVCVEETQKFGSLGSKTHPPLFTTNQLKQKRLRSASGNGSDLTILA